MIGSTLITIKHLLVLKNLRLSNLKRNQRFGLYLVLIMIVLSFALLIKTDQDQKKHLVFLRKNSPYYSYFNNYFKNQVFRNAWEKDITLDGKPEFIFTHRKANCVDCKIILSIFQGEKLIFKTFVNNPEIILKEKGFILNNGKDRYYQWTDNEFKETSEMIDLG